MLNKIKNSKGEIEIGVIGGIFALVLVIALITMVVCIERVPVGYEGVVFSMSGGVQDETLSQGWHLVSPTKKVKEFTVGNEQLILTKDKREGSTDDESFRVATSDNASIAISFQMSYRFIPEDLVNTYKRFKGMDGNDIVEKRVKTVLKAKISEITTDYSLMDLYSGNRSEVNNKITDYLNTEFAKAYGIEVLDASIIDVHPDEQLKNAINNRIEAQQKADQAKAEQQTAKVEAETALIKAQNEADIARAEAQGEADSELIKAKAEAEANGVLSSSITEELIRMKEAEARLKHGWVTVNGASSVVTKGE